MRKAWLLVALLGLGVVLAGCIPTSLHPVCTEQEATLAPKLPGRWKSDNGEIWTFKKVNGKAYQLTVPQEGSRAIWRAYVTNLGTYTFLDMYPAPTEAEMKVFERYTTVALHVPMLMKLDSDRLQLAIMSPDWLETQLDQGTASVKVEAPEEGIFPVITAPTAELRQFLLQAASDPAAFPDPEVFTRVKQEKSTTPPRKSARAPAP
jgi:hypothetical protein